jgi:hypothetical protein
VLTPLQTWGCSHLFCKACIATYISTAIKDGKTTQGVCI